MNELIVERWSHLPKGFTGLASRINPYFKLKQLRYYIGKKNYIALGKICMNQLNGVYGIVATGNGNAMTVNRSDFWRRAWNSLKEFENEELIEYMLANMLGEG